MKTPKDVFKSLIQRAQEWRIFRGAPFSYEKLDQRQRDIYSKEVGKFITHLPDFERNLITDLKADDMKTERHEDVYQPVPKRKRSAAIRLVVNNDKK